MTNEQHPILKIDRIRVTGTGHVASTRITDPKTGDELRFIENLTLSIKDGIWAADLQVSPVEMDIEARVLRRVRHCPNCDRYQELTPETIEAGPRVQVRKGFVNEGQSGRTLGPPVLSPETGQSWTPVIWDGCEDPNFFKTAGLEPEPSGKHAHC